MAQTWYVAHCPVPEICGRGGRRLGSFPSKEQALDKVKHHLVHSSHHCLGDHDAAELVADMELETEIYDEQQQQQWPERHAPYSAKGKGKGKEHGKEHGKGSGSQAGIHAAVRDAVSAALGQHAIVPRGNSSSGSVVGNADTRLVERIAKCEVSARHAARMSRAAAAAFEEQAAAFREVLDEINGVTITTFPH